MNMYPVARYRFTFAVTESIRLPEYAGSMLRGAFGRALRRTACMIHEKTCKGCPLFQTCPYAAIFEAPPPVSHSLQKFTQIPAPYVIEPPVWGAKVYQEGETLEFSMVLVGRAIGQLALIIYAWQRAFAHEVGHGRARLVSVSLKESQGETIIFDATSKTLVTHEAVLPRFDSSMSNVSLVFSTPLRLQDNGRALPSERLDVRRFMAALVRRVALLSEFHMGEKLDVDFGRLVALADGIQDVKDLRWADWTRYSSRQNQTMQLGGVVGRWVLSGVPDELVPYLYLGQWLHVGKNASFGLGKYELEVSPDFKGIETRPR